MKKNLLVAISVLFMLSAVAQDERRDIRSALAVSVGAGVDYYYGPGDQNFGKFNTDRVNWQANTMVGIVLGRSRSNSRTILGAFGSVGFNNATTMKQIFDDQQYVTTAVNQDNSNNSFQLEGGILIADILRVSTGIGQQNFASQSIASINGIQFNSKLLKYNSSTVALHYKLGLASLIISCNFNYGKDYNKTVIKPSAGLMLNL
ncbi:MAG: hypothetical protein ABIN94_01475 [Ferruginibacter sp.]